MVFSGVTLLCVTKGAIYEGFAVVISMVVRAVARWDLDSLVHRGLACLMLVAEELVQLHLDSLAFQMVEEVVVHLACRCDDGYATQVFDAMHLEAVVDRLQVLRGALVPLQVPLSLVHADPRFRAS